MSKPVLVGIYCDTSSLWYYARQFAQRDGLKGRVDYRKLLGRLINGRIVVGAKAYIRMDSGNPIPNIGKFAIALKHLDIEPRIVGNWLPISGLIHQATIVDNEMAECDVIVIASGEGNFGHLAECLHSRGQKLEIHAFPVESPILSNKQCADSFVDLDGEVLEERGE